MKTMAESIKEIGKKYGFDVKVEYDHARQFNITLKRPGHYFEVFETYLEDVTEMALDATTNYLVYRNNSLCFMGNDMYDQLFLQLLDNALSTTI